ncbi:MAG: serine hydrolase [Gemmataceae bacterium]|nr:serine hydrolase [Gemmata sp.]MDW8198486.1 serine hydrolase [Gemmataceae bacterium]
MASRIFSLLLVLGLAAPAAAQPAVAPTEPYRPVAAALEKLIRHELDDKAIPAISIALVDDQKVVWAAGFGFQDRRRTIPATAETVYRVGSVSKLFTDLAVMQLMEEGKIDIDADIARYIPEFRPAYQPGEKKITLRMLMAHRAGLIREPPVGNYFDPSEPSLEKSVLSLNGIGLVYPPESRTKYSNAGIGVVGFAVEKTQGEEFAKYMQRRVLEPLGMKSSGFVLTAALKRQLADAVMWTYHGQEFPAPTFELGVAPAGCLYSTAIDLAKFQAMLFAGGRVNGQRFMRAETLAEMFRPQFVPPGTKFGFGLGFAVGEFEGKRRVGHGGAIYGFSTTFTALPDEKLGVIVLSSRDSTNGVTNRMAQEALRQMLAVKAGTPRPTITTSQPLTPDEIASLAGRYRAFGTTLELIASFGQLYLQTHSGGARLRLRKLGDALIVDDRQEWGTTITRRGDTLTIGTTTFRKEKPTPTPPEPAPAKYRGLIGEYGWDHLPLVIYEHNGQLFALIEHTEIDPLTEESENVFAFPADRGMYHGEKLVFTRDANGRATQVTVASVVMQRRKIAGDDGQTFRVQPRKPIAEVRQAALAAQPPSEKGEFRAPELVDLATFEGLKFDIRYATDNNFLGTPFYTRAKAYLQKPAAEALARVHKQLAAYGYGLLVYDAYRPWYVTKMFWDATPEKFHNFVANPAQGSRHNRGCAVDVSLYDLQTGQPVEMVSGYDEFSDRAFPDYLGGTSRQRWHRDLLRRLMEAEGFHVYEQEWWHFDYKDWPKYPIMNKPFEELK